MHTLNTRSTTNYATCIHLNPPPPPPPPPIDGLLAFIEMNSSFLTSHLISGTYVFTPCVSVAQS